MKLCIVLLSFVYIISAFDPSNTVIIHGVRFALLDDSSPTSTTSECQRTSLPIPSESSHWKLASPSNPIHRIAVASYPWGTACLVMDGGVSLVSQTVESCGNNTLVISNGKYSVHGCDQKILLFQDTDVDLAAEFISCSSFSTLQGNCEAWQSETNTPIEFQDSLHTYWAEGDDTISITQEATVSESVSEFLATGFSFSVDSVCITDDQSSFIHPLTYFVEVTIVYKHQEEETHTLSFTDSTCQGTWKRKSFSLVPKNRIKSMRISFQFLPANPTSVFWKDLTISSIDNLLQNPSFHGDFGLMKDWNRVGDGYMPDLPRVDDDDSFTSSLLLVTSQMDIYTYSIQGASQSLAGDNWANNEYIRSLYIGAWSKTYELTGTMDDNFGVVLDISYSDGTFCYGQVLQFPTGTSGQWIYSDQVFHLPKAAVAVNVTVLLRGHTGAAWVDQVYLSVVRARETPIPCNMGLFGDSRIKTSFDEIYSFQIPGEYTLFTSPSLNIQSRHVSFQDTPGTVVSAVAVETESTIISIQFDEAGPDGWTKEERTEDASIYINGQLIDRSDSAILIPSVGVLSRQDYITYIPTATGEMSISYSSSSVSVDDSSHQETSYSSIPPADDYDEISVIDKSIRVDDDLEYGLRSRVQASVFRLDMADKEILIHSRFLLDDDFDYTGQVPDKIAGYLQVVVSLTPEECETATGLFGNGAKQTLETNTGDPVDILKAEQAIIDATVKTWLVTSSNSLFHYASGESSSDYYHPNTTAPITEDQGCTYWAMVDCDRQALTGLNESCIEDVLLLKNNPFIIQNYHTLEGQLHIVRAPVSEVIGRDGLSFFPDDVSVDAGSGLMLTVVISVGVILIIIALGVLYRRRKRAKKVVQRAQTEIELEEMLTDNERAEMFE